MLVVRPFGPVTQFRMARAVFGRPLYWVCAYHVDGLLIDTGCVHTVDELLTALGDLPVTQVINTHHHEDHVGGNGAVARRYGVPVRIHPAGVELLRRPWRLPPYRRLVWGTPAPFEAEPLGEWIETARYAFRVVHVPGHSPDQVVLFEEHTGWLFAADLYLGERVKWLRQDEHLGQSLDSLRRVCGLPVGRLFCSLGAVIDDGRGALEAKLSYWEAVCDRVFALHASGLPPARIRREVLGKEGLLRWISSGDFSKQHLVDEALALVADQRNRPDEGRWAPT